jgi:hypothetical protein
MKLEDFSLSRGAKLRANSRVFEPNPLYVKFFHFVEVEIVITLSSFVTIGLFVTF